MDWHFDLPDTDEPASWHSADLLHLAVDERSRASFLLREQCESLPAGDSGEGGQPFPEARITIFRAFTDNDVWFRKDLLAAGLQRLALHRRWQEGGYEVAEYIGTKGLGFRQSLRFTRPGSELMRIDARFEPIGELSPLPRIGLGMQLPSELGRLSWFGRGPWESYPDRSASADLGWYESSIDDESPLYLRPQHFGNRSEVRWLKLTDDQGAGLEFLFDRPMSFTASRYTEEQLDNARHRNGEPRKFTPLVPTPFVNLTIDAATMGLGGASCGPPPMEQYILRAKPIEFSLVIRRLAG